MNKIAELDPQERILRVVRRLPEYIKQRFTKHAYNIVEREERYPNIVELQAFLERVSKEQNDPVLKSLREDMAKSTEGSKKGHVRSLESATSMATVSVPSGIKHCALCDKDNHNLYRCYKFKRMPSEKRSDFVKSKNLCFRCFGNHI